RRRERRRARDPRRDPRPHLRLVLHDQGGRTRHRPRPRDRPPHRRRPPRRLADGRLPPGPHDLPRPAAVCMIYGGIEAGGTKWVCAVGTGPDDLETATFPTTSPGETLARAADFFLRRDSPAAVGVGSFGPLALRPGSPTWGYITTAPKPGWRDTAGA